MKTPRIANAIGQMDDDLVISAAKCETKNKKHWLKWSSLAACFAVFVIAGAAILPSLLGEDAAPGGRYKNYSIDVSNSAIVWPWEYQTIYEKYTNVEIDGIEYSWKRPCACQKHWLTRRLATTLRLDMMKPIMGKNILLSLGHTH